MTELELKPCPFCGYQSQTVEGGERFYVVCRNPECYAALGEIYDACAMPEHHFATPEQAIAAWNTRATPEPTPLTEEERDEMFMLMLKASNAAGDSLYAALAALLERFELRRRV